MMIRKMMLVAFAAAGLLAGAADAGTKGPLTFDFQAASDRMFPKREGVGGNLFKVEDGAFKSTGVALRCIQRKPDPDILKKLEPKVAAAFRNGEGLIRIDESAKELFRENPIECASVYAALRQRVELPDDKGGLYVINFDSQCAGDRGLVTGAFIVPVFEGKTRAERKVGKDIRQHTHGDDSEWFPITWEVLIPPGYNHLDVSMCRYAPGHFRFRNISITKASAEGSPDVTLRQGAHGCAESSFAIGEGQSGYITWEWKRRPDFTPLSARETRFELTLPKGFEMVGINFANAKTICREALPDGGTRIAFAPGGRNAAPKTTYERRSQMGAVIRATGPVGTEGVGTLRAVKKDGSSYSTVAETRFFTVPKVVAKVPRDYTTGILPVMDPFDDDEAAAASLTRTIVEAGARWIVTGAKPWVKHWRAAGATILTDTEWPMRDGYFVGPPQGRPEEDKFRTTPNNWNGGCLVCPSAVYEERPFFMTNTVPWLNRILKDYDGIWANWEPYKYFGESACMCDTCRRKFAEYVGVSEEEMKKDWPKELRSGGKWGDRIAAFRAREHGRLVKTVDKYVRAATGGEKSVGFMPGISWGQISSTWRSRHNSPEVCHLEYAGSLKWLEPWGPYPRWDNASPYFHREGGGFLECFLAARDAKEQVARDYPPERRPKLQAFPQGYQCGGIIQPEQMEIELDSFFFNGWESAVLYHFPGGYDARYWRALANATERAAKYEDFVVRGERVDGKVGFAVDPKTDRKVKNPCGFIDLPEASLVQHAAYRLNGKLIVAVFNFREVPVKVSLAGRGEFTVPPVKTTVLEFGEGR